MLPVEAAPHQLPTTSPVSTLVPTLGSSSTSTPPQSPTKSQVLQSSAAAEEEVPQLLLLPTPLLFLPPPPLRRLLQLAGLAPLLSGASAVVSAILVLLVA